MFLLKVTFGKLDDIDDFCVKKKVDVDDVIFDEMMQCQQDHERKCYNTEETVFKSYKVSH